MRKLLIRRLVTAGGIYASVVLGFLATVVATRGLAPQQFGDYATVIFAAGLFQSLFDLTVEEALIKYGFRYTARGDWGRLHRLFSNACWFKLWDLAAGAVGLVILSRVAPSRLQTPLLIGAGIPLTIARGARRGCPLFAQPI